MMKKILLSLALLFGLSSQAFATCASTFQIKDNLAATGSVKYSDDGSGNCLPNLSLFQWAGSNLGAMANYGTSPGAVLVPGVNAFVTNTVTAQGAQSNASDAVATGSISSPTLSYNYGFNGTTWDRLQVDGSKQLKVIDGNSAALLAAAQAGTATNGATYPSASVGVGGDGLSAEPAAVTTGQIVPAMRDLVGKDVTSPYAPRELQLRCAVTITGTGATTCTGMGAQGASVKIYITDLCITRNDAGTTAVSVTLNDSATTIVDIPNNGGGGGFCKTYNTPLAVAANTAFQVTMSGSITSMHISATGFKGY